MTTIFPSTFSKIQLCSINPHLWLSQHKFDKFMPNTQCLNASSKEGQNTFVQEYIDLVRTHMHTCAC
jgi:hypothetical protein